MKKIILYSICVMTVIELISGCTKKLDKIDLFTLIPTVPIEPRTIQVLEKYTNKPVEEATVYLKKCSHYDNEFGCTQYTTHTILVTNKVGEVTVTGSMPTDAVEVQHNNYWTVFTHGTGGITLTPKVLLEVSIKKVHSYAPDGVLWTAVHETNSILYLKWTTFPLPLDTLVYLYGYGYSDNQISWYVKYSNIGPVNSSPSFYLSKPNMAKVDIEY